MCSCRDFGMVVNVPSLSASARSSGRVHKRWQSFLNYPLQPPSLLRHKGPADCPGASAINLRTGNATTGLEPARLCRSLLLNRLVRPTTAKMNKLGIETGRDLRAQSVAFLQEHFGKAGALYYWIARGIDKRPVRAHRVRKSVGAENTFSADLFTFEAARDALSPIIDKVWSHCERTGTRGRTVTLKIKYADFRQITRRQSLRGLIEGRSVLEEISLELLKAQFPVTKGIR